MQDKDDAVIGVVKVFLLFSCMKGLLEQIFLSVCNCGPLILCQKRSNILAKLLLPALSQYGEFPQGFIAFIVQYNKYLLLSPLTLPEIRGLAECFN